MKLAFAEQMRRLDERAQNEWHLSGDLLMERAALAAAREIRMFCGEQKLLKVHICCGKGNNGGDGLALARILMGEGYDITAVLLYSSQEYRGLAALNLQRAQVFGVRLTYWSENTGEELKKADVIVDAILGTGTFGPPRESIIQAVRMINDSKKPVVALDIPTGVHPDTGAVLGEAIRAGVTITFGVGKPGLYSYPGAEYAGRVVIDSIGFPNVLLEADELAVRILTPVQARQVLPRRGPAAHKGTSGHLLVVGGSPGMYGAPALTTLAALRAGCGLVTAAVRKVDDFLDKPMEVIAVDWNQALDRMAQFRAVVIGPGLSMAADGLQLLEQIVNSWDGPLVIDADGLNLLGSHQALFERIKQPTILTPHPGEMARLTGLEITAIQQDRLGIARLYAEKWQKVVVLKGARTVIAMPDGEVYLNLTGNPGMATAGMGDVLAGIVGSLIVQGLPVEMAGVLGTYLHGLAGDAAAHRRGPVGIVAGDLMMEIPEVYQRMWADESL